MDINPAEPLVPEPSLVEAEIAIGKLKHYKSPGKKVKVEGRDVPVLN
jgi:hypothetical protein